MIQGLQMLHPETCDSARLLSLAGLAGLPVRK